MAIWNIINFVILFIVSIYFLGLSYGEMYGVIMYE